MNQDNQALESVDRVLEFWFGPLTAGVADAASRKRWFAADPAFDQEVTRRFGPLLDAAQKGALDRWLDAPPGRLAFIIVTDQFSRQIHRGSARAFETDPLALSAARDGVEVGHDRKLGIDERVFFYLPFEHSESRLDQHTSVGLFAALAMDTPVSSRTQSEETLRFARAHRDIVLEFGRFPHRNASLGRVSSESELAFLRSASRFGQ